MDKPDTSRKANTESPLIFYGNEWFMQKQLETWISGGIKPVCFTDKDENNRGTVTLGGAEYELLPLHNALQNYPDADFCITARNDVAHIYDYLTKEGVSPSRIYRIANGILKSAPNIPQHCPHIGREFVVDGNGVATCCMIGYSAKIKGSGCINDDIAQYQAFCERLRTDLNDGKLTCCLGCPKLRDGRSENKPEIKFINISTGVPGQRNCNFKCSYCSYDLNSQKVWNERQDNVLEILTQLGELSSVETICYASGEIGISPYRQEIIELWKNKRWKGVFFTNASIYMKELQDLIEQGLVTLNVSVDAGTAETFAKIKSVDCFDKVVGNLRKYATLERVITLKYIILDETNCGKADLDGFISIAKDIKSKVIITRNFSLSAVPMSEREYFAAAYLAKQCILQNLQYSFIQAIPSSDVDKLKEDGLWVLSTNSIFLEGK